MELVMFLYILKGIVALNSARYTLSELGYQFQPANNIEILSITNNIRTAMHCATFCNQNIQCSTFDYDSMTKRCRLFEGSIDTGQLLKNVSTSVVGGVIIEPSMFSLYNAPSNQCLDSRFLNSSTSSGLCECPMNTFWNGSMCLNQRYAGGACVNTGWCRRDLLYNCISSVCEASITPPCTSQTTTGGILYSITNPSSSTYPAYTCYAYTFIATKSSATLSFFFRHDPGAWMLDDIQVYHSSAQLIQNGGFETGNLSGWTYSGSCFLTGGYADYDSSDAKSHSTL